jgi:hypothetical protein
LKISINKKLRNGLAHGVVDRVIALYAALHIAAGRYKQVENASFNLTNCCENKQN